jgi:hypothetical protein
MTKEEQKVVLVKRKIKAIMNSTNCVDKSTFSALSKLVNERERERTDFCKDK